MRSTGTRLLFFSSSFLFAFSESWHFFLLCVEEAIEAKQEIGTLPISALRLSISATPQQSRRKPLGAPRPE